MRSLRGFGMLGAVAMVAALVMAVGTPAEASPRPGADGPMITAKLKMESPPLLAMGTAAVAVGAVVAGPVVRAKFRLNDVQPAPYGDGKVLHFWPVYDPDLPEDQRFSKATPSGRLEMLVDNPAALEKLDLHKDYYLDFTPVE